MLLKITLFYLSISAVSTADDSDTVDSTVNTEAEVGTTTENRDDLMSNSSISSLDIDDEEIVDPDQDGLMVVMNDTSSDTNLQQSSINRTIVNDEMVDSPGNDEDVVGTTTENQVGVLLSNRTISSLDVDDKKLINPQQEGLNSVSMNTSSDSNRQQTSINRTIVGEGIAKTNITTITNNTTISNPQNLVHNNTSNLTNTWNLGHQGIMYGKWVGLIKDNKGHAGLNSFTSFNGGLGNYGQIYNQAFTRFPQRNYGKWRGTPYIGISNIESINLPAGFGNFFPRYNFNGISNHGAGFDGSRIHPSMQGNMHSAKNLNRFANGGIGSKFPIAEVYSKGNWIPMQRQRYNIFSDHVYGNWQPMSYSQKFGNVHPGHTFKGQRFNSFRFFPTENFKGYRFGGHNFRTYGEHFPSYMW